MLPIYLILSSLVLYSVASIIRKKISEVDENLNYIYSILFQLMGGTAVFIFSLLLGFGQEYKEFLPSINLYIIVKIFISATLWFCATVTSLKALNKITASKYSIIQALSPLISIVLAVIFLSESFNQQQIIGMSLILASVFAVVYDKNERFSRFTKGEFIALFSAFLSGSALVNDKGIYSVTPLTPTLATLFILPGLLGILYKPSELKKLSLVKKDKNVIKQLVTISAISGFAGILYYKAMVLSNSISLVVSISQLSVVLTVILSLIFLKEIKNWQVKIIASIVSVIGLIFMSI